MEINKETERKRMLDLVENPPRQTLELPSGVSSPLAQDFLSIFTSQIWTTLTDLERLSVKASGLHTALDRALYESETEKQKWIEEKNCAENEIQRLRTSQQWQNDVKQWASKSNSLKGDLCDFAARMQEDIELGEFSEKEMPLLERLTKISTEIANISNTSSLVPKLASAEKAVNDIRKDFYQRKIGFEQAWRGIELHQKDGRVAHGQDVASRARDLLNESACIHTKLAQSKNFPTWSAYQMAQQKRHYAQGFKKAEDRIEFLRKLLQVTKEAYNQFLDSRFSEISGSDRSNFRRSQLGLVTLEADTLIRDYFPKEKIEDQWQKAMIENGFDKEKLASIFLDGYPRANKYTHAYMNCVADHKPKILQVGGKTGLDVSASRDWHNAQIYIVQNYRDDGPLAWTTAFHEGGHALDYSYREDLLGFGAAYGYIETHSMMMEHFFEDIDYLLAVGQTRDGNRLTREQAKRYVENSKKNKLLEMRRQIGNALFDLLVWNQQYTDSSEPFVDRALAAYGEIQTEASLAQGHTIDGVDWRMSLFSTGHFYSGEVHYFGYIVADMAAALSADALWRKFERHSGRRTFLQQPSMATELIEGYYKHGFLTEFPRSIEQFTGKPFSPESFVDSILQNT